MLLALFALFSAVAAGSQPKKRKILQEMSSQPVGTKNFFGIPMSPGVTAKRGAAPSGKACEPGQWPCSDGRCIPIAWRCDGVTHCHDAGDEFGCGWNSTCGRAQFRCAVSGLCIASAWRCDGELDCGPNDNSDEEPNLCEKDFKCPGNEARCASAVGGAWQCVPVENYCDGRRHCKDGSDEWDICDNFTKSQCAPLNCSVGCRPTQNGLSCYCNKGYEPVNGTCVDTDECQSYLSCSQTCENTAGSFRCGCASGFVLQPDGNSCDPYTGPGEDPPSLVIVTTTSIIRTYMNETEAPAHRHLKALDVKAIDINYANGTICYIHRNVTRSAFVCMDDKDFSKKTILPTPKLLPDYDSITYLRYDWLSRNWYLFDSSRSALFLCTYYMEYCRIIMEIQDLRGLAVNPLEGVLYYSVWGATPPGIYSASLSGQGPESLTSRKLVYPSALAFDPPSRALYWADSYLGVVDTLAGGKRYTVAEYVSQGVHQLGVLGEWVYLPVWRGGVAIRPRRPPPSPPAAPAAPSPAVGPKAPAATAVLVLASQLQPAVPHPCATKNGGCAHICVPFWINGTRHAQCLCEHGYRLAGRTQCQRVETNAFILVARGSPPMIQALVLNNKDKTLEAFRPAAAARPAAADTYNGKIYYCDVYRYEIVTVDIESGARTLFHAGNNVDTCQDVAVDWIGRNLYWTDDALGQICVSSLKKPNTTKILVKEADFKPRSILLDPPEGMMYWSVWASGGTGAVESAFMDGSNRTTLYRGGEWPSGIALQKETKILYWVDARADVLHRMDLITKKVSVVDIVSPHKPYGLVVYEDAIYWSEHATGIVWKLQNNNITKAWQLRPPLYHMRLVDNIGRIEDSRCSSSNCSALCLLRGAAAACACAGGSCAAPRAPAPRCQHGHFRCTAGECIETVYVCDGDADCADGSDEDASPTGPCANMTCTEEGALQCDTSRCIPKQWICDGLKDCLDGADEAPASCIGRNATQPFDTAAECSNMFACASGACVPWEFYCDGHADCAGADDEQHCYSKNQTSYLSSKTQALLNPCEDHEFQCDNKYECIRKEFRCDGTSDCEDGSDETGCPARAPRPAAAAPPAPCDAPAIRCDNNTRCVPVEDQCDGSRDCVDGGDEDTCDQTVCVATRCSHTCLVTASGALCSCPSGHWLASDNATCRRAVRCDQIGKPYRNRYKCSCYEGYKLAEDGYTCKATDGAGALLVLACRHSLRAVPLGAPGAARALLSSPRNAVGVAWRARGQSPPGTTLYWTDTAADKIYSAHLAHSTLSNIEVVISEGVSTAEGLAVDWLSGNLYWVDSSLHQIEVASHDGKYRRTLISSDMDNPRAIAVDPTAGLLFWSDWSGSASRIERCTLAGENRTRIATPLGGQGWPNGVALDIPEQRLYWCDAKEDAIYSATYDGKDVQVVVQGHSALDHPFALRVFGSQVYWTDWRAVAVLHANKRGASSAQTLIHTTQQPADLTIIHPALQPSGPNPCAINNGGCSQLCLLSPHARRRCACAHSARLHEDGTTCVPHTTQLVIGRRTELRALGLDPPAGQLSASVWGASPAEIYSLEDRWFWLDTQANELRYVKAGSSAPQTAVESGPIIQSFAVVPSQKLLIYARDDGVMAAGWEGQRITCIVYNMNVTALTYSAKRFEMFFASPLPKWHINSSRLDGSERKTWVSSPDVHTPMSLTVDDDRMRLYWIDMGSSSIAYIDLNTKKITTIPLEAGAHPVAMDVYGGRVIFADTDGVISNCTDAGQCQQIVDNYDGVVSLRVHGSPPPPPTRPLPPCAGRCEHHCLPLGAREHKCVCALTYTANGAECGPRDEMILLSVGWEMRSVFPVRVPGALKRPSLSIPGAADAMAYTAAGAWLYWTDSDAGSMWRVRRDNTDRQQLLQQHDVNEDWLAGIAVDWLGGHVYWADTQRLLVETAKTDGSKRFVLLDTAPHAVTGLAIDPFRGWLFLSGRLLQRVRLDGSGLETLRENPVIDVEVDMARELVYFIESDKICRMRYDGTQLDIMREAAHGEHYVAVLPYGDKIFWLDTMYLNGSVMLAPLTNLSDNYVLGSNLGDNLKDILVWSARMQNRRPASITVRNPCEVIIPVKRTTNIYNETLQMPMPHPTEEIPNFGPPCEGLCTWNGKEKVCKCPHGTLANDSVSCVPFDTFLMYSKVTKIESIHLEDADNLNPPYPPIEDKDLMRNAIALAYEFATRTLFYSDIQRGSINVVHFNGTGHQVFLTKTGAVEGMVFSASDRVLYWTSASDATVRSLRLDAAEPAAGRGACDERSCERVDRVHTIYRLPAGARPRAIDLDPCEMRLYWTNWNETRPSIQRGYSSGLRLQSIITTAILMPNGLALDHGPRQLYWSDARLDKLERANYDGTSRLIVSQTNTQHPFSLTVAGGWLVWGDWVARGVFRTHKLAGGGGLMRRVLKPMAVVAVSPRQPVCSTDPCAYLNGGCPEICISTPTPSGLFAKCACAAGRELARDGRACVDKEPCAPAQWRCAEGGCIPEELVCDGVSHCGDVEGSDENLYYCTSRECPSDQLSCGVGGRCIAKSAACDARADCDDASDERACPLPPGHYRCDDGMAVPVPARCDGAVDCDDGSDERRCANPLATLDTLTSTTAEPTDFPLPTLPPLGCSMDEFACLSHDECIPLSWQCNRQRDCQDGSDEHEHCPHHNEPVCGAGQQFCASRGACISSDADCPAAGTGTNVTGPFSVPAENCTDPQYICDGDIDCPDGADEVGCPDGVSQTSIGVSGVTENPGELCGVSAGAVECLGKCIPPELVCDGADHCLDGLGMGFGSDEDPRLCASWERMFGALGDLGATSLAACGRGNWRCQNAACVPWDKLCDGNDDCGDYSDERHCNINECTNFNGGCAQLCVDLPVGWTCGCRLGMRRERAGNCNPIDMCAERPCHHICTKRGDSFRCSCHAGYRLLDDFSSCVPISNERPSILFTNRYYVRRTWLSIDGSAESTSLLIHNLTNGVALDVDLKNDCIYWSDVTRLGSSIKRTCNVSKEPTSHELLQGAALQSPDGVGVDWVGGNLYWMDGALFVARLTGARRRVLLRAPLQAPRALQLLPMRGVLYWTDWGASPHIGRCGMDGSSPTLLVTRGLGWPNALTIDYPANAIYFADAREDYIARVDLEGKGLKVLFSRENQPWLRLHHVFALGAWGGRLYWSDWETKAIESCRILPLNSYKEKYNPNPTEEKYDPKPSTEPYGGAFVCRTVVSTIHRPMDLRIAHSSRQPEMPELSAACAALNCEGLCVLAPTADGSVAARCVCPEQWALADRRRCEPRCSPAQRACLHSMQCIPAWWRCDTQDDCGDGSDEPPDCRAFHCRPGQFQCDTATCLHPARLCDAVPHCLDASDEGAHCDHFTCLSSQWKCPGNATLGTHARCIPLSSRCDSRADCPDAADERDCAPPTCPTHNFMCRGGGCVPDVWVCDEDNDCPDGSDEGTLCLARTCPPGHFRCGSGRCIPTEWLCDTEPDCPGHEDEDKCDADRRPCDPTYFKCPDGRCIPGRWKCDYEDDCGDGADEAGCVARNCSESEQRCADGACALRCAAAAACPPRALRCRHTALCVPSAWWCDGDVDCGDGSDEAECPDVPPCDVPEHWRCDGKRDCLDGSDEDPATCAHRPCTGTMFRCPDAKCIPDNLLCDGVNDCSDKSDESYLLCDASLRQVRLGAECRPPLVLCDDFSCVPDAMICDREPKCDWRECSQICLPRYHHNVTCKCIAGYKQFQLPDGSHACEPIGDRPILVTVSSSSTIRFSELVKQDHDEEDEAANSTEHITTLTTAYIEGSWWLYWGTNTGYVYRLNVTRPAMDRVLGPVATDRKEILITENGTISGVSIASELLFYSTWNRARGSVRVSSVDGLKRYTLYSEARSLPTAIAANADTSEVFWSETGPRAGIRTIHFSGANLRWLVRTRIRRPRALALFYPARRLYFVDSYSDELLTVAVDGTDLQTMGVFKHKMSLVNVTTNYKAPDPPLPPDTPPTIPSRTCLSLSPWGEWLLCGSLGVSRLPRRPPRAPRAPAPAPQPRGRVHAIAVLQRAANVNEEEHPCAENPCDASALCIPDRQLMEHKCVCPDHMKHNVTVNKVLKCSISPHNTTCGLSCGAGACILDSSGAATCRCSSLFAGEHCQHYRCAGYCKHGVCAATNETGDDGLAKLTCICHPRYTGSRCESLIHDPCAGYCLNQGTCHVSVDGSARCACAAQWAGPRCHVAADSLDQSPAAGVPCGPLRCQHGGRCISVTGPAGAPAAACECAGAWGGAACSVYVGFDHACAAKGCAPPSVCVWRSEDAFIQNPSYCACLDGASCVPPTDVTVTSGVESGAGSGAGGVVAVITMVIMLLLATTAGVVYWIKRRRHGAWVHARLADNVEINNPVYQPNEDDEQVHTNNGGNHFANPVYESMYTPQHPTEEQATLLEGAEGGEGSPPPPERAALL